MTMENSGYGQNLYVLPSLGDIQKQKDAES